MTNLLPKMGVVKEDYYFVPDTYTYNNVDHSHPQPALMDGPQFGMPFQMTISGFVANASLAENAGVRLPSCEDSWTWDDWTEWDLKMTDPEAGTFGTWARDDYLSQYMPQMYSTGLKKPFDDGLTKTMFDQPQALKAWEYLINKIHVHQTAPRPEQVKAIYDSHTNPFDAWCCWRLAVSQGVHHVVGAFPNPGQLRMDVAASGYGAGWRAGRARLVGSAESRDPRGLA